MSNVELPLVGLKVVAIEQAVAAPFCTSRLADAGAEVIKIERPEGDFARGYDTVAAGQSSYFVWLNRGKKSLTLDLTRPEAKARLAEILQDTDVLVQNLKLGALDRLGFGVKKLADEYPRLITCSITGYGDHGPMADRKAYDLLVQAESGLCSITGSPAEPSRVGISIVDIATGSTAYSAILEALLLRLNTGRGSTISISMFDVMADWLASPLLNHEGGNSPKRIGMAHPSIAPYGVFRTRDGKAILISVQSDREWVNLCRDFLYRPELGTDPCFANNVARVANRERTDKVVSEGFARLESEEAVEKLRGADIAFASVNDMEQLSNHPHLRRITVDTPKGPVFLPAPAPIFAGEERRYGPVPPLNKLES